MSNLPGGTQRNSARPRIGLPTVHAVFPLGIHGHEQGRLQALLFVTGAQVSVMRGLWNSDLLLSAGFLL